MMTINSSPHKNDLQEHEKKIIAIISKKLGDKLFVVKTQERQHRARARKSFVTQGDHNKYFIELAETDTQTFFLKRSIHHSKKFKKIIRYATVNLPLLEGEVDGIYFVLFSHLDGHTSKRDFSGEQILEELYANHTFTKKISLKVVNQIESAFLASWPSEYHFFIQSLPEYIEYRDLLKSFKEIILCPEHGDFAANNILDTTHGRYLIDFEFSRENQPAGFDLYSYNYSAHKTTLFWEKKYYYKELHKIKLRLLREISFAMDNYLSEVVTHQVISSSIKNKVLDLLDETPMEQVKKTAVFFTEQEDNKCNYFVTIWNKNKLSGFAAFNKTKNILHSMHTKNNLPVLYFANSQQLALLIKYIAKYKLGISLKNIPKHSDSYHQLNHIISKALAFSSSFSADRKKHISREEKLSLFGEIAEYIENIKIDNVGNCTSIYNRRNRIINLRFQINKIAEIVHGISHMTKASTTFLFEKIDIKKFVIFLFCYPKNRLKWRNSRKKGNALFLKIGYFSPFIRSLNENGVDYVVLRGLENGNLRLDEDLDFLLNAAHIHKVIKIASLFPGKTCCNLYFDKYQSVDCIPYYPHFFAVKILESKNQNNNGCYVPNKYFHLLSLLYHITYHKGFSSGFGLNSDKISHQSKYFNTITHLAKVTGQENMLRLSLIEFHRFLKETGFNMPYDMLVKWPKRHKLLDLLRDTEKKKLLAEIPDKLDNIAVFLIRADAVEQDIVKHITQEISKKFKVLFFEKLTKKQINLATEHTRGGAWFELYKNSFHLVEPRIILVCRPNIPYTFSPNEKQNAVNKKHQQESISIKYIIRKTINERFPTTSWRHALHSSDSPCESMDYLKTIYPETYKNLLKKAAESL